MSLNVQTELEVNMTVRITGRDQITGEDISKLNAVIAAVQALGGVIDYPPVVGDGGSEQPYISEIILAANIMAQEIQYVPGHTIQTVNDDVVAGFFVSHGIAIGQTKDIVVLSSNYRQILLTIDGGSIQLPMYFPEQGAVFAHNTQSPDNPYVLQNGRAAGSEVLIPVADVPVPYKVVMQRTGDKTATVSLRTMEGDLINELAITSLTSVPRFSVSVELLNTDDPFTLGFIEYSNQET